jgi:dTDP-4-dehydrorhamnose reductase
MKRILITGTNGLLGQSLLKILCSENIVLASSQEQLAVLPPSNWEYQQLNITNYDHCKEIFRNFAPEVVINAAAFTDVDGCENEKELCWQVNVKGVENLAMLARRYDIHFIQYSTDYIFNGENGPYSESDRPSPLGYYGKSKHAAENVLRQIGCDAAIIRTCVLFGTGYKIKNNFFLWILENLQAKNKINVVVDQYNNPTLAEDLALGTKAVIDTAAKGIFHLAGKDYLSRYDFALAIANNFNFSQDLILPIYTKELKQKAARPLRGGLKIEYSQSELGFNPRSINETLIYLNWKMGKNG